MILPEEFLNRTRTFLGAETGLLAEALQTRPPVSIRHNPAKALNQSGLKEAVPWATNAFYLEERPVFTLDPAFHAGGYYVQEASSMFLESAVKQHVNLSLPLKVLDLCAAPGGKTTHLASLLKSTDLLVSNEVVRQRADILMENVQKWGSGNIMVTRNDPASFSTLEGYFDLAVVDAPCSGEGMFRKDPAAIREWSVNNVRLCAERQKKILSDTWPCLKPGGILVYSTCTYNLEENEDIIRWALTLPGAENLPLQFDRKTGIRQAFDEQVHAARFFPHLVKGEGLFMSVLRKNNGRNSAKIAARKLPSLEKKWETALSCWTTIPNSRWARVEGQAIAIRPDVYDDVQKLCTFLFPVYMETAAAQIKGADLVPHPALALSTLLDAGHFPQLQLDRKQALALMAREIPSISGHTEGWHLATYEGLGIAWIKVMKNRINNYFPKEWRIRMDISREV